MNRMGLPQIGQFSLGLDWALPMSLEALRDLADNDGAGWDINKTFEAHRDQIEVIASAKHDRAQFASGDGDQAQIVISTAELNG